MHCSQWIFDMDGTLTDSMTVVWEGAPDALLRRYGLTPQPADNGWLLPTMEDARLAALVQDLAAEGAGVVGVERQTKNLEEIFLSLTNTQTGKEVG